MALTEAFAGSELITTTEHSLPRDAAYDSGQPQTDDGIYQVFIDVSAIVAADLFRVRIYEKVQSTDTQRVVYEAFIGGPQASPIWVSPSLILEHAWDVTLIKIAGTNRTITWSIRRVI